MASKAWRCDRLPRATSEHDLELRSQVGRSSRAGGLGKFPGHQGRECQRPSADSLGDEVLAERARLGGPEPSADSRGLMVILKVMQLAQRTGGRRAVAAWS